MLKIIDWKEKDGYTDELTILIKDYFGEIDGEPYCYEDAHQYLLNAEKQLMKYPSLKMLLLLDKDYICGFLFGNLNYLYNNENCSFILELFIKREKRKNGYGKYLVNYFEGISNPKITYLTSSKSAYVFYEKLGFMSNNEVDNDNHKRIYKKVRDC